MFSSSNTTKDRSAARIPQPPAHLQGAPGLKDFDLRTDAKALWVQVAGAYNLSAVFDGDYETGPPIHFQLTEVDFRGALHAAEAICVKSPFSDLAHSHPAQNPTAMSAIPLLRFQQRKQPPR